MSHGLWSFLDHLPCSWLQLISRRQQMKDVISEFWRCFVAHRQELERIKTADEPVYDVVLQALQEVDDGLYFEFCSTPGTNEFIVTAEGD